MRSNSHKAALLAAALCAAASSSAGAEAPEAKALTVDAAVKEALAANLSIIGEGIKVAVKKRDAEEAINRLYPSLTAAAGLSNLNDMRAQKKLVAYSPVAGNIYMTPESTNLALQVNAQFTFSFAVLAAMKQTTVDYANSRISKELAEQRLERDVRKTFYQLLVLKETIAVTGKQLENAERRYREALGNQKAGQASELTVLQAKVAWDNKKPNLEELKVTYEQLLFAFEALLGRDPDPGVVLDGSLDIDIPVAAGTDQKATADRLIGKRLDVRAAEGQVRAAAGILEIQKALLYPTISVQYSADPVLNDPFNGSQWKAENWYQRSGALSLLATWKLDSFFPGSVFANQKADIADQGALASTALDQTRLSAKAEALTLFAKIDKSVSAMKTLSESVDSALQAFKLTETAYKTGARSLLEAQDAELQYQVAQLNLLHEKQLLNAALLDLETALNTPREEIYGKR